VCWPGADRSASGKAGLNRGNSVVNDASTKVTKQLGDTGPLQTLAKADKLTVTVARLDGGKLRCTGLPGGLREHRAPSACPPGQGSPGCGTRTPAGLEVTPSHQRLDFHGTYLAGQSAFPGVVYDGKGACARLASGVFWAGWAQSSWFDVTVGAIGFIGCALSSARPLN
jgi:hypothetical protein